MFGIFADRSFLLEISQFIFWFHIILINNFIMTKSFITTYFWKVLYHRDPPS